MKDSHYKGFDTMRGIAISAVLFYHIIPHYLGDGNSDFWVHLLTTLDQFQIPLFLFISGYFFYLSNTKDLTFKKLIEKKFFRLLVPYFIFGTLLFMTKALYFYLNGTYEFYYMDYLESMVSLHAVRVIDGHGLGFGPMWFLYMLFIITIINYFLFKKRYIGNISFLLFLIYAIFFIEIIPKSADYSIESLCYFIIPFQLGYILNQQKVTIFNFINNPTKKIIITVTLLISILVYKYFEYTSLVDSKTILIASLIILFVFFLFEIIGDFKILNFLGKKSMPIYLLHGPYFIFISLYINKLTGFGNIAVEVLIAFLIAVIGPLLLDYFYDRFNVYLKEIFKDYNYLSRAKT